MIAGATGFTGKLVLEFYLTNYPDLKIAVAGRNKAKLEAVVGEVKEIGEGHCLLFSSFTRSSSLLFSALAFPKPQAPALGLHSSSARSSASVPILVADASDWSATFALARSTRVVVTLAGPFASIGQKLVDACAHSGTHYADITGETGWVRQNVHRLSEPASKSGAVLASLCGHDSVPWEFSAKALEAKLKEKGEVRA